MNRGAVSWLVKQPRDESADERSDDPQDPGHEDSHVLCAGHDEAGNRPHNDADDEHPYVVQQGFSPYRFRGSQRASPLLLEVIILAWGIVLKGATVPVERRAFDAGWRESTQPCDSVAWGS